MFAKDSVTLHIHRNHSINTRKHPIPTPLGKVYNKILVVPSSSPHQRAFTCRACTGTAQVGVSLVPSRGFSPKPTRAPRSQPNQVEMQFFSLFPTCGSRRLTFCPTCDNASSDGGFCRSSAKCRPAATAGRKVTCGEKK